MDIDTGWLLTVDCCVCVPCACAYIAYDVRTREFVWWYIFLVVLFVHSFDPFVRFPLHNKLEYILAFEEFHMRLPHGCVIRYNAVAIHGANMSNKQKEIHWLYAMKCKVNSAPTKKSHKLGICFQVRSLSTRSTYITLHYTNAMPVLSSSSSSQLSFSRSRYNFSLSLNWRQNFRLRFICKCLAFDCIQHLNSMSRITNYG